MDKFKYSILGYRVPIGRFQEILKYNDYGWKTWFGKARASEDRS